MDGRRMTAGSALLAHLVFTALTIFAAVAVGSASAADMTKYFTGKIITIIVGSSPGGGVDTTARLYAKFASKHHPGHPGFIVKNIKGGGQLKGLQTGMRAKPDGMTAVSLHPRWAVRSILGQDLGPFNVRTARVLGSPVAVGRPGVICADSKAFGSWKAVLASKQPLKIGASAPGGQRELGAALLSLVGGPVKIVYGYGGSSESLAAFDRGELNGTACAEDIIPRLYPEWLTKKRLVPLFWWTNPPSAAYVARMGTKGKPVNVIDLPGVKFTEEHKIALRVAQKMFVFTRALLLPPRTPDEIYGAWRKAYEATIQDPQLVATAAKAGITVGLGRAEDFRAAIADAGKLSKNGLALFKKLMGVKKRKKKKKKKKKK